MRPLWTGAEIAKATGGTVAQDFDVRGVAFDSREVGPGDLFVAMKGEAADGHDYVAGAFAAGAAGALVSRAVDGPHVRVPDTLDGLIRMARHARARTDAKIIGVTGSAGKTGTKEALYRALNRMSFGAAHRSLKSYNNHVGVPLSLARMPQATRYGVFEMGMNHAGELSALTALVRPDIAIITTIAPAHIEFFGSEENIARAKAEIFEGLSEDGVAIIPHDSPHAALLTAAARDYTDHVLTFGFGEGADVRAVEHMASDEGSLIAAELPDARLSFTLAAPGRHWVGNALAVLAAVYALDGDLAQAGLALAELPSLPGRGARLPITLASGGAALLIDESYNANPASMAATLAQLGEESATRRIAVLGAMKELGERSDELHAGLAEAVRAAEVDRLVLVGAEMQALADALTGGPSCSCVETVDQALAELADEIADGDVLLVKGSNSVGLARLVDALRAETV